MLHFTHINDTIACGSLRAYSFLSSHLSRTSLTYTTFTMKIMSGRVNMTQAQLAALIQEQVAAALAAAQAGGISCSHSTH
ncbi:hypothetical protein Hanom_Chr09g00785251 [Helianthus anomalus]